MKKYTTYTRKYKDQSDCKNFGKQFDSMFDSMGEMFSSMSSLFNTVSESSITEEENKTIIEKHGKTYVIDKDGKVTVNGKQMVEMCDKPYNPYNYIASDTPIKKTETELLNDKVHELDKKVENLHWSLGIGLIICCGISLLLSILICNCPK